LSANDHTLSTSTPLPRMNLQVEYSLNSSATSTLSFLATRASNRISGKCNKNSLVPDVGVTNHHESPQHSLWCKIKNMAQGGYHSPLDKMSASSPVFQEALRIRSLRGGATLLRELIRSLDAACWNELKDQRSPQTPASHFLLYLMGRIPFVVTCRTY
jgi:hypothetical protein